MAKYERFTIHERRALEFLARTSRASTLTEIHTRGALGLGRTKALETLEGLADRGLLGRIPPRTEEHQSTHPRNRRFWITRTGREAIGAPPLSLRAWNADNVRSDPLEKGITE